MGAKAVRLTEAKLKNAAPKASDYVLGDGDGLHIFFKQKTAYEM